MQASKTLLFRVVYLIKRRFRVFNTITLIWHKQFARLRHVTRIFVHNLFAYHRFTRIDLSQRKIAIYKANCLTIRSTESRFIPLFFFFFFSCFLPFVRLVATESLLFFLGQYSLRATKRYKFSLTVLPIQSLYK